MRRSRQFWGHKLFVILQQSQTEGEWLSLTVQHIWKHCRQVLIYHLWGEKRQMVNIPIYKHTTQSLLIYSSAWRNHFLSIENRPYSKIDAANNKQSSYNRDALKCPSTIEESLPFHSLLPTWKNNDFFTLIILSAEVLYPCLLAVCFGPPEQRVPTHWRGRSG